MKVEFISLEKVGAKDRWLRNLLVNIPLWDRLVQLVSILCENQAVIARAKNSIYNGNNKYILLRHNIVRRMLNNDVRSLNFVRLERNLANLLTKPFDRSATKDTSIG